MKRRAPETPTRPAVPSSFDPEEDSVELLVTEENGSSSRVICIAIDGDELARGSARTDGAPDLAPGRRHRL